MVFPHSWNGPILTPSTLAAGLGRMQSFRPKPAREELAHRLVEVAMEGAAIKATCVCTNRGNEPGRARRQKRKMSGTGNFMILGRYRQEPSHHAFITLVGHIGVVGTVPELHRRSDMR